ncbi:MAG: 50S ribosomal protein L10 [Chitinophagia bacterium]|nr:50S ribosomal protein L10 [Chitinophagia bacterium]
MTPQEKQVVVADLKEKFSKYDSFYITDTDALTVAQVSKLRRICFEKQVELKVAKNTLIKKALDQIDAERYKDTYPALHGVTALMFSESAKDPAFIISSFREDAKAERPKLKLAYVDGAVFVGNESLETLKSLKSKQQLLGEVIGLLQSPAQRVISALNGGAKLAGLVKAIEDKKGGSAE